MAITPTGIPPVGDFVVYRHLYSKQRAVEGAGLYGARSHLRHL